MFLIDITNLIDLYWQSYGQWIPLQNLHHQEINFPITKK